MFSKNQIIFFEMIDRYKSVSNSNFSIEILTSFELHLINKVPYYLSNVTCGYKLNFSYCRCISS